MVGSASLSLRSERDRGGVDADQALFPSSRGPGSRRGEMDVGEHALGILDHARQRAIGSEHLVRGATVDDEAVGGDQVAIERQGKGAPPE